MKTKWLDNFLNLFFPHLCLACGERPIKNKEIICLKCQSTLPETNMHLSKENRFTDRFWGRIDLSAGAALYAFQKGGTVQQLIHKLKYHNRPNIGLQLGIYYGKKLNKTVLFKNIDAIVPVPLHPQKQRQRGYNQSTQFALGLSESLKKPIIHKGLKRIKYGESQTRKSKTKRYEDILQAFEIHHGNLLKNKHILLVDDVLTTGATLETCASKILALTNTKVSMVTIAMGGLE